MIITRLMGGLGNQMFQYAYARHLSIKLNIPFFIETSFYDNQQGNGVIREFELHKFANTTRNNYEQIDNQGLFLQINEGINVDIVSNIYNYILNGYWQSENYFKESESLIKDDFAPTEKQLAKIIRPELDTNTISLHVRRTDFANTNGNHPIQEISYYKNAIAEIGDYDNLLIFSDDIEWCKENFTFDNMIFVEGQDDVEDLWLMSLCKNNIIANSSFSWWGAWLNNNPNKKVIAPNKWFCDENNINALEIIPKNWIKI